jgi:glycosyltransferase involved in cell wall biosynthesis
MPEVAGNAAIYVDPHNAGEIVESMYKLVSDASLRNQLIENGRERRSMFCWDTSAKALWNTIERSL